MCFIKQDGEYIVVFSLQGSSFFSFCRVRFQCFNVVSL